MGVILSILGICLIVLILILIEEIITKKICNKTKYRIIKGDGEKYYNRVVYKLQESFLWIFWTTIDEFPVGIYSVDDVKNEIKRLKNINKKEVLYEE